MSDTVKVVSLLRQRAQWQRWRVDMEKQTEISRTLGNPIFIPYLKTVGTY